MKWIGQSITDFIARFRAPVYLEDDVTLSTGKSITMDEYTSGTISITKIQDSGTTFNDNDTSLMTAAAIADKVEAYGYSTTAGDITAVVAGTNLSGGATSGSATITLADASDTVKGAASFHEEDFIVSSGVVTLIDLTTTHLAAATLVTESEKISGNDNDTTLPTSAAVRDYVDKQSTRVYGDVIKLLPTDFLPNEDAGASKTMTFDDTAPTGMKPGAAAMELVAIIDIPQGRKATHVDVYDNSHNLGIQAFEMNINASGLTSKGSGNANTQLDITDVNATATNYLAIIVTTTATTNRVWGGAVTIADQ